MGATGSVPHGACPARFCRRAWRPLVGIHYCCGWQMNFLLTLAALHCSALQSAPAQAYTAAWCAERSRTGLHGRLVCVFGNSISRPLQRSSIGDGQNPL
ncbi:unnamed protein product [Prorocentrum cordatum]|uniref:Secreted protein n=1 Tax=Prorocentrum cordatum TaxID=2364126 RepID=A0ABN9RKW5_9DINO|nr:unnamed protein product [Polarella glacialis]